MEKIKTLAQVTLTQRTAVGHIADDTTVVYIMSNYEENNEVKAILAEDITEAVQCDNPTIVGKVLVHHPSLLWGMWEENYNSICQSAMKAIEDIGLITYNRYGIAFLK